MNEFQLKREKWLKEVVEHCHEYALKTDIDFYCCQTPIIYKPEILIIGLNPGNNGKYSEYLINNHITKRTIESLYYSQNLLVESALDWDDGLNQIRKKFKEIFFSDLLFSKLKNSVMTNFTYFNTISSTELQSIDIEIKQFCLNKTFELIEILQPKNIIIFTSNIVELKKSGVEKIEQVGKYTKIGTLNDKKIIAIPHFSARGYNNSEIRNSIGREINEILR
ncbi:hypothetical protein [Empedobacter sp. 189-2]|uniref:hypothetical protein n=1 Tax=Empedobacter sp. 189-2 TaxID=2746724 RepID=UPI002578B423|nr:hypothetical protein [Empedobacter sp. 189-2]MDM1543901.1 hypothetical protein [Empedobacter sp. 189-2]